MGSFTVKKVQSLIKEGSPGRFSDGGGLYLMVPKKGAPYWMLRYTLAGKRRELTLGSCEQISLAEAREQAIEAKKGIRIGIDPIETRKREEQATLRTVSDLFGDWCQDLDKRLKHPHIPKRIFTKEVAPSIGQFTLDSVTPLDVRTIVRTVASSGRPATANDTLMYLKQLFNHAIKLGLLTYNPR